MFVKEFFYFIKKRKKYWMLPAVLVILVIGILVFLSASTPLAPFIYTIF